MSVLPLSLFLRVEGGASRWVLRRGSLPKREVQRRVTSGPGLGAKLQAGS